MRRQALTIALGAVMLQGCISLLPESDPVQMYRFGDLDVSAEAPLAPGARVVSLSRVEVNAPAAGDRLLTVNGGQLAYIAASRWAAPADDMLADAIDAAFLRQGRTVRLAERRDLAAAPVSLDVDVLALETRYVNGSDAAPVVVLSAHARLVRRSDREVVAERTFALSEAASDNRVGAIVQAYDAAVGRFTGDLVGWTEAQSW